MKRWPRVTVLLVNYNRWRDTLECLESVLRLDYPDLRVLVCDNGSSDGSLERLTAWANGGLAPEPAESARLRAMSWPPVEKPLSYRVCTCEEAETGVVAGDDPALLFVDMGGNRGFTGANNSGFRHLLARAGSGYVWVLNNDTVVAPDALTRLVEVAEADEGLGVVGARLLHYGSPDELQAAGGGYITRWNGMPHLLTDREGGVASPDHPERVDYVHGASMLIPLRVLRQIGLFDDRYFVYSEEADWCFRMQRQGFRMAYAPAAKVWHKEGLTMGRRTPFQDYLVVRNTLLLVHRFFTPYAPLALLYSVYRCFLPKLLRGEWARLAAIGRAYRDFVREAMRDGRRQPAPPVPAGVPRWAERPAS